MSTISLLDETRISFSALAHQEDVNISTVWRWSLRGCKGHRLESFNVGGKRFTTLAAYDRWLLKINGEQYIKPQALQRRQRAIELAEDALVAVGA